MWRLLFRLKQLGLNLQCKVSLTENTDYKTDLSCYRSGFLACSDLARLYISSRPIMYSSLLNILLSNRPNYWCAEVVLYFCAGDSSHQAHCDLATLTVETLRFIARALFLEQPISFRPYFTPFLYSSSRRRRPLPFLVPLHPTSLTGGREADS